MHEYLGKRTFLDNETLWYKLESKKWNSLDSEERKCINTEYENILRSFNKHEYRNPCSTGIGMCENFCKNSRILEDHIHSNNELKKLLMYISHPTPTVKSHTKLLPFCFTGSEAENFNKELTELDITMLDYEYCTQSFQRLTDIGICTTINVKENLKFPTGGESDIFETGINLILDSSYSIDMKDLNSIKDYDTSAMIENGKLEQKYTPLDPALGGHKFLIHQRDEIPLFLGPKSTVNIIKPGSSFSKWVREIKLPIQVRFVFMKFTHL